MPYCPKCGVEVESSICPLCSHIIKQDIHRIPFSHTVHIEKKNFYLSTKEKISIFHASTVFLALLISSVCITVDIFSDSTLSWSVYPIIASGTIALITTASLYITGILKVITILILCLLMMFLIDIVIPVKNFFLMISLPISFISSILSLIIYILIKKSKKRGTNIPGYILIGVALLTLSVDLIIQNFITGSPNLTWSLLTSVSLLPIALFLLYIHYVLSKRIDLSKVFHT